MRTLIGLPSSPWTEKARWALDHHRVDYRFHPYMPMLGEAALRLRTRRLTGAVTVPVLLEEGAVYADSIGIAERAERSFEGAPLIPAARRREVLAWNEASDVALRAGRAQFFARLAKSPQALLEQVPPFAPRSARPLLVPAIRATVAYLRRKYGADDEAVRRADEELRASLTSLGEALGGSEHLLGEFTYADVAMAVTLQFIQPVGDQYIRLTPAVRACWTHEALAREFADLVAWRDALYAAHRPSRPRRAAR